MLATGKSFIRSIDALHKHGVPNHIHIASLVAASEGIVKLPIPFRPLVLMITSITNPTLYPD
jgi:uracil phosphoribosyltransferase